MDSNPVVTVILPVWRGVTCINETVESIIAQTFSDWEMLIMGEPGSDNSIKEISRAYAMEHNKIRYIENQVHLGLAATLNKGIELARGRYIARVDVDDPAYATRFEKQVSFMESNPDIAVCGTQQLNVFPTSLSQTTMFPLESDDIVTCMLFYCCNGHSSLFLRRELFILKNWRYPTDRVQEDFALWLSLADKARFANLNEVLAERRIGMPDNLTSIHAEKMAQTSLALLSEFYQKYFNIDLSKYETSLFVCRYGHNEKLIDLDKFSTWITECVDIFQTMERRNSSFNTSALSRTLRKQWNWMLEKYFCFDSWIKLYNIHLPHLPVESDGSFSFTMAEVLGCKPSEIKDILKKAADKFVHFVKADVMTNNFRAIVFGVGFFCENFFDKVPNWEELFELVAFCDNDNSKVGKTKLGKQIISASALTNTDFDFVLISSRDYYTAIHSQLTSIGLPAEKILPLEIFRLRAKR